MIRVEIVGQVVEEKRGVSARTGKPYAIREQEAWFHTCSKDGKPRPHPERGVVVIDDNAAPYPAGQYVICPSSVYMGRFGSPELRVVLRPVSVGAGQPVATARAA